MEDKLYKIIEGVGLPFRPIFNRYGLRDCYLGYGGGSGSIEFFYKKEEFKMNIATEWQLRHLAYVHGDYADLMSGKTCVVRNGLETYREEALNKNLIINQGEKNEFYLEKSTKVYKLSNKQLKSIKTENGKTLIFIGQTYNGNHKIILK